MAFSVNELLRRGIHYLDTFIPTVNENALILFMKLACIAGLGYSILMVIAQPWGPLDNFLYSGIRLPLTGYLELLAEYPQAFHVWSLYFYPEQSMHWTTVISTCLLLLFFLVKLPQKGFTSLHTVTYSILVAFGSFVFPFEWIYTTLMDFFHNPAWQLTLYGTWNWGQGKWFDSVIGRNGFMAFCLLFAWFIGQDAMRGQLKLRLNKISTILFGGILAGFAFWILLPIIFPSVFANAFTKGSSWFPQDIYVWYGQSTWITQGYDIVKEVWVPGGIGALYSGISGQPLVETLFYFPAPSVWYGIIMRVTNEIVKGLCTVWAAYTFLPMTEGERVKGLIRSIKG